MLIDLKITKSKQESEKNGENPLSDGRTFGSVRILHELGI